MSWRIIILLLRNRFFYLTFIFSRDLFYLLISLLCQRFKFHFKFSILSSQIINDNLMKIFFVMRILKGIFNLSLKSSIKTCNLSNFLIFFLQFSLKFIIFFNSKTIKLFFELVNIEIQGLN